MSDKIWISSNATDDALWHLGELHETRLSSGQLLYRTHRTLCNHKQLGGAWGSSAAAEPPARGRICPRCHKIEQKHNGDTHDEQ